MREIRVRKMENIFVFGRWQGGEIEFIVALIMYMWDVLGQACGLPWFVQYCKYIDRREGLTLAV